MRPRHGGSGARSLRIAGPCRTTSPSPDSPPPQRWRSLVAVIASVFGVGVGVGALVPLMSIVLEARGVGTVLIGVNSAMLPLAVLLVTPFLPRVAARLGT